MLALAEMQSLPLDEKTLPLHAVSDVRLEASEKQTAARTLGCSALTSSQRANCVELLKKLQTPVSEVKEVWS